MTSSKLGAEKALDGTNALVICTEWKIFHSPGFEIIRKKLVTPVIFDGRNLYDPSQISHYGFND